MNPEQMRTGPGLAVYQSLWAMEDLPRDDEPWSLGEQVERIADAGFAGVAVDLGARRAPTAADLASVIGGTGLTPMVLAFVADTTALRTAIEYAHRVGARRMILCAQIYGFDPMPLSETIVGWYELCAREGIDLQLETHRNTVTNDLRFTVALLDQLDDRVEVSCDLSHFVVANEIPDDPDDTYEALIDRVLARCGSLQGRIATRGQVQIPLGTSAGAPWERRFRGWWETGFRHLRRTADRDEVVFCTELGTRPYAMTDVDGREISDRWADALTLKHWAEECFESAAVTLQEQR